MKYLETIKNDIRQLHPLPIFIVFIVLISVFTHSYIDSTNPASRFITMESLVEERTFVVNEKHIYTDDKMIRQGNYYSSKPPALTITGSGIYYVLHNFFGLNLPEKPYFFTINTAVYLITFFLIGGTYLLLLLYFYKTLNLLKIQKKYQTLLLAGLGLGTLYLTYSITLNNHTIAGSFLFISFYYLLKTKINNPDPAAQKKYLALSGLFVSLSAVIDLPAGLTFLALFFIYVFFTISKKQSAYYVAAVIPIIIIHLFFNYQITGDLLPAQFHPEYGDYNNVVWNELGGAGNNQGDKDWNSLFYEKNPFLYAFNILFGSHGLLSYSPILLFAFYAIYKIIRNKHPFRFEAVLISLGFLIIFLLYTIKMRVYTGSAFGFRWLIAITPLIYFFSIFLFTPLNKTANLVKYGKLSNKANLSKHNYRDDIYLTGSTKKISSKFSNAFILILIISIAISFVGFLNPWAHPRLIIETQTSEYTIHCPFLTNLTKIYHSF